MQKNQSLSPKPSQRQVNTLSRRQVLQLAGLAGTAVAVAACGESVAVSDEVTRVAKQALIGEGPPGELRVGFSQSDITPPVGATITGAGLVRSVGTDDPLLARTLVAQSGDRLLEAREAVCRDGRRPAKAHGHAQQNERPSHLCV